MSAPAAATDLRQQVLDARRRAAEAHHSGASGLEVAHLLSDGIADVVRQAFARAMALHPLPGAALLSVGGFGRRELAPHSDVDLLLLVPEGAGEIAEQLARELFTPLWDAGLEPGAALRTVHEALETAAADQTAATALLDARCIAGDSQTFGRLMESYWALASGERLEAFIDAKVQEIVQRRARFGGSVYLLEPNVKTGVGGLRDLAGALWIVRARHHVAGLTGVEKLGLLPRREVEQLRAARDTLLRLRCQLHLQAKRRDDRLTFAAQEQMARALGYQDTPGALGVELLMRDYYLAAQTVEHACEALVDRCTHEAVPRKEPSEARPLTNELEAFDGRVTFRRESDLAANPALLVELFAAAESEGLPVHSSARDLVAHEVERLGESLSTNRQAMGAFLEYLESPGATGQALRGMYETGVIGGLFPEFARLKARVQHDVYHVYTVDTHTLFALQKLLRLRAGLMGGEQPVFTRLCQDLPRPLPLYVGLFFHDLGKGLGGDHSTKGEGLVRGWAERSEVDAATVEDAAFLVREHLKLSQVAFRRDLSDPALVRDVARLMGTRERLDMLYLLTFADISSVGPETWNDWRSRLLAELYEKVRAELELEGQGAPSPDRTAAAAAGARALRHLVRPSEPGLESFLSVLPERYLATVPPVSARAHLDLWRRAQGQLVTGTLVARPGVSEAAELVIVTDDRPGLLALIAGTLAAHSIDILGAEIFSLKDGRVLDAFLVHEPGGQPPSAQRLAATMHDLERVLRGQESVPALLARRRGARRQFAPGPAAPTKVRFDLAAAQDATVVDVFTQDRVGLLHDIADAIRRAGASIVLARVATEGNRAADGFYLQDLSGRKITDEQALARLQHALDAALQVEVA